MPETGALTLLFIGIVYAAMGIGMLFKDHEILGAASLVGGLVMLYAGASDKEPKQGEKS